MDTPHWTLMKQAINGYTVPPKNSKMNFMGKGISSKKPDKMMSTVTTLTHPTLRKSSPGDCNLVVTKLDPAAIPTDISDIDIEVISK